MHSQPAARAEVPETRIAALGVLGRLGPRFVLAVADRLPDEDQRVLRAMQLAVQLLS